MSDTDHSAKYLVVCCCWVVQKAATSNTETQTLSPPRSNSCHSFQWWANNEVVGHLQVRMHPWLLFQRGNEPSIQHAKVEPDGRAERSLIRSSWWMLMCCLIYCFLFIDWLDFYWKNLVKNDDFQRRIISMILRWEVFGKIVVDNKRHQWCSVVGLKWPWSSNDEMSSWWQLWVAPSLHGGPYFSGPPL